MSKSKGVPNMTLLRVTLRLWVWLSTLATTHLPTSTPHVTGWVCWQEQKRWNCVTQLKLYTEYKLSSPIFCCLSGIGVTRPNLHFLQYIQAYKPFADHVSPNSKQYQLILTKYQPVSSYTDPVPSSTSYNSSSRKAQLSQLNNLSFYDSFDESRTVYLV